jgi:acyl carrier protein
MPEPDRNHTPASRPPQTPLQQTLCDIFSSLLDVPHIGIDDSFFELGGQSLQAMRLCTRIGNTVGVGISMNTLFDSPTVAQLATYISTKQGTNQDSTLSR